MGANADEAVNALGDAEPPIKLRRSNRRIAALFSWKVLLPLCVLSVGMIATAIGIRAHRRYEALTYLTDQGVDYVLASDSEWITHWFGERALGLRTVEVIDASSLPDDGWDRIAELDEITHFEWSRRMPVPDGAWAALKHLRHLETVKFSGWAFSDDALVEFFSTRPPLVEVSLEIGSVSNPMLRELSLISTITRLEIVSHVTDPVAYGELTTLPNLRRVVIDGDIDGAGMEWLTRSPRLESLTVYNATLIDAEIALLASATELREVEFVYCPQISHEGWEHLVSLPHLTSITLTPGKVTPEAIEVFRRMPSLSEVNAYGPIPLELRAGFEGQSLRFTINESARRY